jgi:hypothetical protein
MAEFIDVVVIEQMGDSTDVYIRDEHGNNIPLVELLVLEDDADGTHETYERVIRIQSNDIERL